jgi:type VI secretion system FHA domain protein
VILILEITSPQLASVAASSRMAFDSAGGSIGRDTDNSWVLPYPTVSAHHAVISYRDGAYYIEDRSRNGVFLNSRRNRLERDRPYALKSGDLLFIDLYEIRVSVTQDQSEATGPSEDPFAPRPIQSAGSDVPPEEIDGRRFDPLELLNQVPKHEQARKVPSVRAPEPGSPLDGHYRLPPVVPAPAPELRPDPIIPEDYDPLALDDASQVSPVSQPEDAIKKQEAGERLRRTVDELLADASEHLQAADRQSPDATAAAHSVALAKDLIARALSLAPDHASAQALKATAESVAAAQRHAAFILAAVGNARTRFANGKHQTAIQLLESLAPSSHPLIASTLEELRGALREIEERRRAEQELAARAGRPTGDEVEAPAIPSPQREPGEGTRTGARAQQREGPAAAPSRVEGGRAGSPIERRERAAAPAGSLGSGAFRFPGLLLSKLRTLASTLMRGVKRDEALSQDELGQSASSAQAQPDDPVLLGVSSPRHASPGITFTARFVAYVKGREAAVHNRLRQLDSDGVRQNLQALVGLAPNRAGRWAIGTPVTVRVSGQHLDVKTPIQSFEWNGAENLVSFLVSVPKTVSPGPTQLCFEAFIESVPIAFIPLNLTIDYESATDDPVTITGRPMSSAFASYASKDAPLVALLLSALKRWDPEADVFMDCLDLTPNENWRHELERVIPSKDAFLLFWSTSASKSPWVAWELQLARATKGLEWIRPMPIDDPEAAPPPDFLLHLHFRDKYLIARQAFLRLQQREPT